MCVLSYKIYIKHMYESYDANFSLFVYANTYTRKKIIILRIHTHTNIQLIMPLVHHFVF